VACAQVRGLSLDLPRRPHRAGFFHVFTKAREGTRLQQEGFIGGSGTCRVSFPTYRSVIMPNSERGGSSEQHAKAGEQSHKNTSGSGSKESGSEGSTRGGSSEQHAKAGEQSHKNTSGSDSKESGSEGSTRGGSHEQHVKAGEQSHKNTSGSDSKESGSEGSTRGGSHEQHVKAGQQSHKNS
jgi:hypothetical protein